jgi:hypothetical protein
LLNVAAGAKFVPSNTPVKNNRVLSVPKNALPVVNASE